MSSKWWVKLIKSPMTVQCALICVAVGLPIAQWRYGDSDQVVSGLRSLKLERLELIRSLGVLRENADLVQSIDSSEKSIESITLSVIESMRKFALTEEIELMQLSVTAGNDERVSAQLPVIRVSFSVALTRAIRLLAFFDVIRNAVEWRPIEVRACSMLRTGQSVNGLNASCVIDIYLFPEIDQ